MIYVMSDIHGNENRFNSVMEQINLNAEDTLYILGDVVDRYYGGIRILRKIMKMPNVKMLMGNHEYMMLDAIDAVSKLSKDWVNNGYCNELNLWYNNGGEVTHRYLKHIRKDLREEVFNYVRNLPINIDITVKGLNYKLVHASPIENRGKEKWSDYRYSSDTEFAVWKRWQISDGVPENSILIFGHTPTRHFQRENPMRVWYGDNAIGIDCGCGYFNGRLSCLRLDDMKEFYSSKGEGV